MKTNKQPASSFFKQYWYVFGLTLLFIGLVVVNILRVITPYESGLNVWNGVRPGKSKVNKLEELGTPILTEQKDSGLHYYYKSEFPTVPTEVVADDKQTVQFIKERVSYDPQHTLKTYIDQYGQPELELFFTPSRGAVKAHVFLDQGLAILSHVTDQSVEQRWYFSPTTKEVFLATWGKELGETENAPGESVAPLNQ